MTQFAARNTPTGVGGFVSGTLAGPDRLRDLVAIPPSATGAWLQADADIGIRMDGVLLGADLQTLPAGTFLPLSNRTQLDLLVLNGSARVHVQFFYGTVGPQPPAPMVGSGGGPPPVPPLTELVTQNVVHVMKNGNDYTAQPNRLDLPFATVQTAELWAINFGYTLMVWPGVYASPNGLTCPAHLVLLPGAVIVLEDLSVRVADGLGPMRISGGGVIRRTEGAAPAISHQGGNLVIDGLTIESATGPCIDQSGMVGQPFSIVSRADLVHTGSEAAIEAYNIQSYGRIRSTGHGIRALNFNVDKGSVLHMGPIDCGGIGLWAGAAVGRMEVHGPIDAGQALFCDGLFGDSTQVVYGTLRGDGTKPTCYLDGSTNRQLVYGDVYGADADGFDEPAVECVSGTQEVFGNTLVKGAKCSGGLQRVHGHAPVALCEGGEQQMLGGVSDASHCAAGKQMLGGAVLPTVTFADGAELVLLSTARLYADPCVGPAGDARFFSAGAWTRFDTAAPRYGMLNVDPELP